MKRQLVYLTNDCGWAIYDAQTKELLAWEQFGHDPFYGFRALADALGGKLESGGTMPEFNGEPPAGKIN